MSYSLPQNSAYKPYLFLQRFEKKSVEQKGGRAQSIFCKAKSISNNDF